MTSSRTPTTRQVRRVYMLAPVDLVKGGNTNPTPEYAATLFDLWLAAHDAEVQAEARKQVVDMVNERLDKPVRPYSDPTFDMTTERESIRGLYGDDVINDLEEILEIALKHGTNPKEPTDG